DIEAELLEADFLGAESHLGRADQTAGVVDQTHDSQPRRLVTAAWPNLEVFEEIDGSPQQRGGAVVGVGRAPGEQRRLRAGLGERNRRRQSGRAAADHDNVVCSGYIVHIGTIDVSGGIFKPLALAKFRLIYAAERRKRRLS